MMKRRVHEIAKDLGLENREALLALQAAGMAVKTHSSTVYEQEALVVLQKLKQKEPEQKPRRPGMMIVKKRRDVEGEEGDKESSSPQRAPSRQAESMASSQETSPVSRDGIEASQSIPQDPHAGVGEREQAADGSSMLRHGGNARSQDSAAQAGEKRSKPTATQAVVLSRPARSVPPPAKSVHGRKPDPSQGADSHQGGAKSGGPGAGLSPNQGRSSGPGQQGRSERQERSHRSSGPQGHDREFHSTREQGGASTPPASPPSAEQSQVGKANPAQPRAEASPSTSAPVAGATGEQAGKTGPAAPVRSKPGTATVVRMIDREKLMERVPSRRLGYGGRSGGGAGGPGDSRGPYRSNNGAPGGHRGSGAGPGGGMGARSGGAPGARPQGPGGPRVGGGPGSRPGGMGGGRFGQAPDMKMPSDPFARGGGAGRDMPGTGWEGKPSAGRSNRTGAGGPAGQRGGPTRRGGHAGGAGRSSGRRDMSEMRERALHPARLRKKKVGKAAFDRADIPQPKASKRVIKMKETIVVADLAHQLGLKAADVIRRLMALGMMVTQNQSIDFDTAQLIATELQYTVESIAFAEASHLAAAIGDDEQAHLLTRPPVVTVMGHVDHGKTSLLDAIRRTKVAAREAGGITQHIGAYSVQVGKKGTVTFLDTPGHAAFTSMRARGAQVTDIVILVVAADDGVMPQTEEAIRHAQAAKVPIVVAVNKIDKPSAQPDRVMQELTKFELVPEAWGGETMFVNTSATDGTGLDSLLESVLLQAEVLELQANPSKPGSGVVVEARLDKGRGPVTTILVQNGTLKRGDAVVIGTCFGKVRAMMDATGAQVEQAGPSCAVELTGLDNVPEAGDTLHVVEHLEVAREIATHRMEQKRGEEKAASTTAVSLDDLMKRMGSDSQHELKVVLKADVQGSVEAMRGALAKLTTDEVKVNVIYGGVGGITESDIMLASASQGIVIGFGVRPDSKARQLAERHGVDLRTYHIIYEAIDAITKAMEGLLTPESKEKVVGRAEVRDLFKVSKVGTIGGCRVLEGKAQRAAKVRVLRDNVQIYDGKVSSLRHFKSDAREVEAGLECGVGVEGFNDLKHGDVLEFYHIEEVARTLQSSSNSNKAGQVAQSSAQHA